MLRSNINTERSDFNKVKELDHVEKVWQMIEKNIPVYFQKMIDGSDELAALKASGMFKVKSAVPDVGKKLSEIFSDGVKILSKGRRQV